ncbi:damage-control phosphatase ARMT1 family protein [Trichocoleus sp. DQ-U1]|uniref:damage-control phosphatase ARMT1 family protein n=1 Tax=Trichocoleus sp. DQ-U1 TaxID=2933926 RepID=UPI0032989785
MSQQILKPRLPLPPPLMMSEEGSFANMTLLKRMPAIAQRAITENDFPASIVDNLETLIRDLPNGIVRSLKDDNGPDLAAWTTYLAPFLGKRWIDIPWLFAELYFFRRIVEATNYFLPGSSQGVDPYGLQKRLGLETAMDSIRAIAARIGHHTSDRHTRLIPLLYFSLWGNRADLSLWPIEAGESDRSRQEIQHEEAHILVDDTPIIADRIASLDGGRIDFIVDNAGFELVCDLCLADFLLTTQAAEISLHLKRYPIFVSDATIQDLHHTLEVLAADVDGEVRSLSHRLQDYIASGRLRCYDDLFWTMPLPFWEMPEALRQELAPASLIFIKGDANYRRCLGNRHWDFTTPFQDIACYFPAPLVALRTLKSELVAGLQQTQIKTLNEEDPQWLTNGQRGVIQFVDFPA